MTRFGKRKKKSVEKARLSEVLASSSYEGIARVGQQSNRLTVERAPKGQQRMNNE